jgi:hypothetical protein
VVSPKTPLKRAAELLVWRKVSSSALRKRSALTNLLLRRAGIDDL